MSLRQIIIYVLLTAFLLGCAFGEDPGSNNRTEINDRSELMKSFSTVVGTYSGTLTSSSIVKTVELILFTVEIPDGKNSDGETIFRPVLRGSYRSIDPAENPLVLDARYLPEVNELVLAASPESVSSGDLDNIITINAKVQGSVITGEAKRQTGTVGSLVLQKVDNGSFAPGSSEENNLADRLRAEYSRIEGIYKGELKPYDPKTAPYIVELRLFVVNVNNANGTALMPVLRGLYKKAGDDSGILDQSLSITYKTNLNPAELYMNSDSNNRTQYYYVSMDAVALPTIDKTEIQLIRGVLKTQKGLQGSFTLEKQKK